MKAQAMKTQAKKTQVSDLVSVVLPPDAAAADTSQPATLETSAAANDDLAGGQRERSENPLWVINIAMVAFFIVAALMIMTS